MDCCHYQPRWKSSSTRLDNRIVEVSFSSQHQTWEFFRFRDDKEHGNHTSVVRKVIQSIREGVEADEVRAQAQTFRVFLLWINLSIQHPVTVTVVLTVDPSPIILAGGSSRQDKGGVEGAGAN